MKIEKIKRTSFVNVLFAPCLLWSRNGKFVTKSFSLIFISLNATSITTLPSLSNVPSTKRNVKNGYHTDNKKRFVCW